MTQQQLTQAQLDEIPGWVRRWTAIGLSTEPADYARWEAGARSCYAFADLSTADLEFAGIGSPHAGAWAAPIAAHLLDEGGACDDIPAGVIPAQWEDAVRETVKALTDGRTKPGPVTAQGIRSAVQSMWGDYFGGAWWCAWQAYTSFLRDVVKHELPGDLWERDAAYSEAQIHTGWWWPHTRFALAADRPEELHMEGLDGTTPRLHSATGPAIGWRDGTAIHVWHGVVVPAWVIDDPTPEQIAAEDNVEVRRCGIESYGWDRYADRLHLVHSDDDPGNPGQRIMLYDVPEQTWGSPVRLVLVTNGTPEADGSRRMYGLTTPATIDNALEAVAWTFRTTADRYRMLARRT